FFCFFFQAEDGIRDDLVTGVQTCALPICRPSPWVLTIALGENTFQFSSTIPRCPGHWKACASSSWECGWRGPEPGASSPTGAQRSEERRVGKEWRRGGGEGEEGREERMMA